MELTDLRASSSVSKISGTALLQKVIILPSYKAQHSDITAYNFSNFTPGDK